LTASRVPESADPVASFGWERAQDVDHLDAAAVAELWAAVHNGTVRQYIAAHPAEALGSCPVLTRGPSSRR
jgi:hypothetical protein